MSRRWIRARSGLRTAQAGVTSATTGTTVLTVPDAPVTAPSGLLQGVYRGSSGVGYSNTLKANNPAGGISEYETFNGHPVDLALTFLDGPGAAGDRWSNFHYPSYVWTPLSGYGRAPCAGFGAFVTTDAASITLDGVQMSHLANSQGAYATHIDTQADSLIAHTAGTGPIYIRLNHEFDINQFGHRAQAGHEADFAASFRFSVTRMRSRTGGSRFRFLWNPTISGGPSNNYNIYTGSYDTVNIDACYPGDAYVDFIAVDMYDIGWYSWSGPEYNYYGGGYTTQQSRDRSWAYKLTGSPTPGNLATDKFNGLFCLNGMRDYAKAGATRNGVPNCPAKPMAMPEVGIWFGPHGGGDNPTYVNNLAAWVKDPANNVKLVAFWEDPDGGGGGVFDPDGTAANGSGGIRVPVPNARAAFLANRPWWSA